MRISRLVLLLICSLLSGCVAEKPVNPSFPLSYPDAAKALVLQIESPGGTTVGSERVYDAIRKVAAKKPVVATVDTLVMVGVG